MTKFFLATFLGVFCFAQTKGQAIAIPTNQYHLYGPNSTWNEYLQIGGNGKATDFAFVATTNGNLHLDAKPGFATYINFYNQGNTLINTLGGHIGVGTYSPEEKLDVNGNLKASRFRTETAAFKQGSRSSFNSFNHAMNGILYSGWIAADFGGADNSTDRLVVGSGLGGKVILGTHNHDLTAWGGDMLINPEGNGNVAIGTSNAREKLSVNGKIRAHEIKVETANWPDYVFDEGYKILGLKELESYIKTRKHLPEMPSATEVEKNGAELGELLKRLLKNQEELTLHLIEKNKEIIKLEKRLSDLESKSKL